MCLALGVDRLDDVAAKLADVLELTPPQGIADKLRALGKLKSLADSSPKTVSRGPCQEVVLDPPDLDRLPIMTCWPSDGGPFITLPSVITKDPKTGGRNVGMYRLHKYDARTTGLHWQIHKDARRGLARGRGAHGGRDRARDRSDHDLLGLGAAAEARRRAHARRVPARPSRSSWCSARPSTCRCPRRPRS